MFLIGLQCMIRLFTGIVCIFISNLSFAASGSIPLKPVLIDLNNKASLQRGAQIYVNNCLGCHTLKYQRYVKFIDHLSLSKETIENNVWPLGDKQANRYKSNNEPLSRFLHYEILPLIEKMTGKQLKPTYTYLSAYKKDSDLPGHTDRADCEYTVSFVVDKPENNNWNLTKQV